MKCLVFGCPNDTKFNITRVSFHRFPSDPMRRSEWLSRLNIRTAKKCSVVCSDHFRPENIFKLPRRAVLREDALPELRMSDSLPSTISTDRDFGSSQGMITTSYIGEMTNASSLQSVDTARNVNISMACTDNMNSIPSFAPSTSTEQHFGSSEIRMTSDYFDDTTQGLSLNGNTVINENSNIVPLNDLTVETSTPLTCFQTDNLIGVSSIAPLTLCGESSERKTTSDYLILNDPSYNSGPLSLVRLASANADVGSFEAMVRTIVKYLQPFVIKV